MEIELIFSEFTFLQISTLQKSCIENSKLKLLNNDIV